MVQADLTPDRTIRDPHRTRSHVQWASSGGHLWVRKDGQVLWTQVRRVKFTPQRFIAIASLFAVDGEMPSDSGAP